MANYARAEIVEESEVGMYHCIARCVRRAFLCGQDPLTGKNFDHRKGWVQDRLRDLASIFAIDVTGFAVMSNHFHVVLRIRPDLTQGWTDEEVARRWWRLFPSRREEDGQPGSPEQFELDALMADAKRLAERRKRLSSLSWFMRCLSEPIARRGNREDGCRGRFFEGRFRSVAILDEAAALTCAMYVDLNPIRAGVAETPETSTYTSAFERIQSQLTTALVTEEASATNENNAARDAWLSPIEEIESRGAVAAAPTSESPSDADLSSRNATQTGKSIPSKPNSPTARASDRGFLSISLETYLKLLDWTGRAFRIGKRGAIPSDLAPIMERLQLNAETWLDSMRNFSRWFRRAAGSPANMRARAEKSGMRWFHGVRRPELAFG